jgi:hypothetical protein
MSCWKLSYNEQIYKQGAQSTTKKQETRNLALERKAAKVGFKINEQKTKYMIVTRNDKTIHALTTI